MALNWMSAGLFADPSQEGILLLAENAVTAPAKVAACRMICGEQGEVVLHAIRYSF